ncbi:DegT/DnrJ/EryC1/StrS aminotransferase family protein [Aliiglaciecola sp. LCG003]|uniref:DegT/DnrJ/EryC1/StrS aminotransferase family protein n=1 Tax=Aliiglaciecola sp. LCG003 TaxID=3053655 RepID=UPI0025732F23|nr:DegT/DnrJ/EryC1/StrS aminotransferase family protein [Aliiglaciecola sp. LCG003]WJG10469.1 DegT/DnrJ/EryC1/StrS aminotransferase family protein [Aliiglaciecola sp. LCG003]
MAVKFLPPIANASQFPVPIVTATPKFRLKDLRLFRPRRDFMSKAIFTRNGRGAIGIAGNTLKKPGKNVILIPAYHCPALVEPFIWLDYEVRFYPVQADLSVDLALLDAAFATEDVTHCVVVRYFGFGQNNDQVIEYLHSKPVEIIEDCAHSMFRFVQHFDPQLTPALDVSASICSINKILPSIDGGALYLKTPFEAKLDQVGVSEEAKACAFLFGIPQFVDKLKSKFSATKSSPQPETLSEQVAQDDGHLRYFQPVDLISASYRHTKEIFCRSYLSEVKQKRRNNFIYLVDKIDNPKVGQALFKTLNDDVPYVVPFLLEDQVHFHTIRKRGIQILRWEEVAISDCPVSQAYRSRLIQIPCHQQLNQSQLDFMVDTINQLTPQDAL